MIRRERKIMNKSKRLLPRFPRYMVNDDRKMHQKGTGLCILSGILIGLALGIMMPAAMALQTMNPQWGLSFRDWVIVLASVALLASVFSFWGGEGGDAYSVEMFRDFALIL